MVREIGNYFIFRLNKFKKWVLQIIGKEEHLVRIFFKRTNKKIPFFLMMSTHCPRFRSPEQNALYLHPFPSTARMPRSTPGHSPKSTRNIHISKGSVRHIS